MPTENKHVVGLRGNEVLILNQPIVPMSRPDALNLAVWLVVVAGYDKATFASAFDACAT